MEHTVGNTKEAGSMEAGRSTFHNDVIYFAAYESLKCYCYSVHTEDWYALDKEMQFRNPGLAIIDGSVATVGGHKDKEPTDQVWIWKPQRKEWKKDKCMSVERSDPAVLTSQYGKYVVAIGGNLHTNFAVSWTPAVEVYDTTIEPSQRKWSTVHSLPGTHEGIEATLCNGIVYVFPDHEYGFKHDLESLVFSKGQGKNNWKLIKHCPLRLSTPTSFAGRVVCIGGTNEKDFGLDHVYMYEENKNSWKKIGRLPRGGRMYTMVEVCNNRLVIVGGRDILTQDSSHRLDRVETFILNSYWSKESKKSV